ncbi:MAG TPA: ATP-binding protein [Steroidobacteraceae bacterium]|nr:ATP-binding protein [Steroidobacteraceae bacterium]
MSLEPSEHIALRAEVSELERLNRWVERLCEYHELPERVALQLDICLTEVVTNIISYAYPETTRSMSAVAVRFALRRPEVAVEIEDHGVPFDPLAYIPAQPASTLEDSQVGGHGLRLVRKFAGEMRYRRDGSLNRLRLTFALPRH